MTRPSKCAVAVLAIAVFLTIAVLGIWRSRSDLSAQARASMALQGFDDGHDGWTANRGDLVQATDPRDVKEGHASLRWRFEYVRNSVFLVTRAGLNRFAGAQGVEVWLKSDHEGPMFLRLDQADGAAFFVVFVVGRDWSLHRFSFDQFKAAAGGGRLVPDRISALYLVDLGGQEKGLTGTRTVWIDDVRVVGALVPAGQADVRNGGLILKAYDAAGALRSAAAWEALGSSGGEYLFASSAQGDSLESRITSADLGGTKVPRVVVAGDRRVTLNVLFWPVRSSGVRWLQADAGGQGYESSGTLNVNFEIARSQQARLRSALKSAGAIPASVRAAKDRIDTLIGEAERADDDVARAAIADRALTAAVAASDELELAIARDAIEHVRSGDLSVEVVREGRPVAGARVSFAQTRSAFRFGCAQSFGFLDHHPSRETLRQVVDLMAEAGFNHFAIPLFWDRIEPRPGAMDLDAWDRALGIDLFHARHFRFSGHAIMQRAMPDHVRNAGPGRITALAKAHFETLIARYRRQYGDAVDIWEAINEPSSNRFVELGLDQKTALVDAIAGTIRRAAPAAKVQVNDYDWDRGQRFKATRFQTELKELISTYDLFAHLNAKGVDYDILGLQWYPGLRVVYGGGIIDLSEPMIDLAATTRIWDRLAGLGKPIHLTEFAVPGEARASWRNGTWKGPWSPAAQADFVTALLTLAYSKPYIDEVTYWGITDLEPWALGGGLLDSQYQPKPVYIAVKSLINSWATRGTAVTNRSGVATVKGHAGEYEVTINHEGRETRAVATITSRQSRSVRIELPKLNSN